MTIFSLNSDWDYVGDGVTLPFSFDNLVAKDTDLDVYLDGILQTITVDYTVTGAGTDAGTVDFLVAPAIGVAVAMVRNTEEDQLTAYPSNNPFPSLSHEAALDKLTIISQENTRDLRKTLRFNPFSLLSDIFVDDLVANKFLGVAANGLSIVMKTVADLGAVVISDLIPFVAGIGSAGVSDEVSRYDHAHPSAKDVAEALTNKIIIDESNLVHANGLHLFIRNESGGQLDLGVPIAVSGWNSGQGAVTVIKADADTAGLYPAFGLIAHNHLPNNTNGFALVSGTLIGNSTYNLDTSGWAVGDALYLGTDVGTLTNVRPTGSDEQVQAIAKVLRSHASQGVVLIQGAGRVNDIPNGLDLGNNLIINGDGEIDQGRDGTDIADDAYGGTARHYVLTQTANITASQGLDGEDGMPFYHRINQDQAVAQRMGRATIIEGANCKHLRGGDAVLSGRFRCSAAQNVRYAILEWTGTEDSVVSDVVNDWTSDNYTAGNFFNATTLAVLATGVVTPQANTWTDLTDITSAVGSTMNNLICMIWVEDVAAQNVTLDWRWQLEEGISSTVFERMLSSVQQANCEWYFERLTYTGSQHICIGYANTSTMFIGEMWFKPKRVSATMSGSDPTTFHVLNSNVVDIGTGIFTFGPGLANGQAKVQMPTATAMAAQGQGCVLRRQTGTCFFEIDAEL